MSVIQYPRNSHYSMTTYETVSTSIAKQKFSFGKADRFPSLKDRGTPVAYELPSQLSLRAASFGYGNKIDLGVGKNGK